jgi:ADP-ribose pyrophosphatase YjhB (NUDIX family)
MRSAEIHPIQAGIMRELFFRDSLHFAEINVDAIPSDQFSYHLRQLLKYGLIEKNEDSQYALSVMGKSRAIMLAPNEGGYIEQGFLAVRVVLSKEEDGQQYFLLQKRTVVPYKGTLATPGDKVLFGEDMYDAARRAIFQQTDLECDVSLSGLKHYKDSYLGRVVQDKYFFVFHATYRKGHLKTNGSKGTNLWLTREQLRTSPRVLQGVVDIIDVALSGRLTIDERTFVVDEY